MTAIGVTRLLVEWSEGSAGALERLFPIVYNDLRRHARRYLGRERAAHTLQPTALVHEAYLRLVGSADVRRWDHRGHFFAAAAEAMRRILIDHARKKAADKRGGELGRAELPDVPAPDRDDRLLALDEALTRLAAEDPVAARVVELHHFAGAGHDAVAGALGITVYAARQKWTYARAFLRASLGRG